MTILLTMPCKCGGRAEVTEIPWRLPYIGLVDVRGRGGAIRATCNRCGKQTTQTHWSHWPTVSGPYTRADAIIDTIEAVKEG